MQDQNWLMLRTILDPSFQYSFRILPPLLLDVGAPQLYIGGGICRRVPDGLLKLLKALQWNRGGFRGSCGNRVVPNEQAIGVGVFSKQL